MFGPKHNPELNPLSDDVCIHCSIPVVVENAIDVCDASGTALAYAHRVCADAVEYENDNWVRVHESDYQFWFGADPVPAHALQRG